MDDNDVRTGSDRPEREYQPRDYRYSIIFYSVFGLIGIFWTVRGIFEISDGTADGLDLVSLVAAVLLVVGDAIYLVSVLRRRARSRR
jgi:hypothetical protein